MSTLKEEIDAYEVVKAQNVPAPTLAIMNDATTDLIATGIENKALKTGDKIPEFSLPNQNNVVSSITERLDASMLVITFYRGGWCPYCNFELNAFQKMIPEFEAAGAKLIAISPEVPDHSLSTQQKHDLSFDILYDKGNEISKEFGLVFTLPQEIRSIYDTFGIDVVDHNGDDTFELPLPATYVVNQAGEIVYDFVDPDYTKRSEPADVLAAVKANA
ncbi:peroxiredoxin-like family protein [Cocleimonas flava]|uniref:thioredoxin-dependent peroxiredoxin n=1 Tax=Cocleimonas flava TaxID=634765 RepID=A0A4R1EWS1_9GAMM|nr:peroxiredoxin-like family protein [Cocleimonas flava]TCJ85230.1 peroxiredoxin [Cocleimonas flava]